MLIILLTLFGCTKTEHSKTEIATTFVDDGVTRIFALAKQCLPTESVVDSARFQAEGNHWLVTFDTTTITVSPKAGTCNGQRVDTEPTVDRVSLAEMVDACWETAQSIPLLGTVESTLINTPEIQWSHDARFVTVYYPETNPTTRPNGRMMGINRFTDRCDVLLMD